jgi:hypothetical protein
MKEDRRLSVAAKSIAYCAASFIALQGMASAGPVTEAGELCGLAMGAPLPPGFYFVDTASIVELGKDYHTNLYVNIPVVAWSTPWTIGTGRIEAYVAVPEVYIGVKGSTSTSAIYNPALLVGMAWSLGNGWSFSNFVGGYAPTAAPALAAQDEWVFNERAALSYTANGYNFTAHITYGVTGNNQRTNLKGTPDYINYDLTGTKTFGKWEAGVVAFGTNDLSQGSSSHLFEAGGLVGYNFGALTGQLYMTHSIDADQASYGDGDTRFFARVIVPL